MFTMLHLQSDHAAIYKTQTNDKKVPTTPTNVLPYSLIAQQSYYDDKLNLTGISLQK